MGPLSSTAALAQLPDPVHITELAVTEDTTGDAGPEQIQEQSSFRTLSLERQRLGADDAVYWLRVRVDNPTREFQQRWLRVGQARLGKISLYQRRADDWQVAHGGARLPFSERSLPTLSQTFSLSVPPEAEREVLLRVTSATAIVIDPALWTTAELLTAERSDTQLEVFAAGAVAVILLFGVTATLMLREPGFLLFGLASLCFLLFRWSIKGIAHRELWPEATDWSQQANGVFLALLGLLITQLHRTLLETSRLFPRIDTFLKLHLLSYGCFAVAFLMLPQRPLMLAMSIWGLLLCLGSPVLGWLAAQRGVPLKGYAFAGYALPWQVIILLYFTGIGWLPAPPVVVSDYAMAVSTLMASLIIPAGLGAKVIQLRQEKESALQHERQRLEEMVNHRTLDLQEATREAEQRLHDHRQFLDMSSHELRSPLASISIASELLADHTKENRPTPIGVIHRVQRATSRMTAYLDNLIAQSRVESSPWSVRRSRQSPRLLLDRTLEQARSVSPDRELVVRAESLPESLNFDLELMQVALSNLLDNALKYSAAPAPITVRAFMEGGNLQMQVSDQGPGIPAEEQAGIFNKYTRGRLAETLPGTGLGLYIVREIARRHQGDSELLCSSGKGTTVRITIPV